MLSSEDLERLIAVKKREIETEKTLLGLAPEVAKNNSSKEKTINKTIKQVQFSTTKTLSEQDDPKPNRARDEESKTKCDLEEIPPDLERYIRRYLGLPVMLKAGEYSPNNPLIRGERPTGDVLLGLGEYERRRNTLRKIRQRQYREYLDQQAKIKQEAKEKAERERREREERERLQEERERQRQLEREQERELERERYSPERRRASVSHTQVPGANNAFSTKVDTGVQVNNVNKPLSVAVQTDNDDLFRLSPTPKNLLTQAERELSPRTVVDPKDDRPIHPASWALKEHWKNIPKEWKDPPQDWQEPPKDWKEPLQDWKDPHRKETKDWRDSGTDWRDPQNQDWKDRNWKEHESEKTKDWNELRKEMERGDWKENGRIWKDGESSERRQERRRSYGDFDERIKRAPREKASSETRTYKPSIFDADAIELRNLQAEKEAAARRQFYQQELKNQILEQQRIREERKTREKMLEQAEMRRLEQQLRSLRAAQEKEIDRQHDLDYKIKDDGVEYERKRNTLQKEIDLEQQSLQRASTQFNKRMTQSSKSDTFPSKLPFYYPRVQDQMVRSQDSTIERLPYSMNIPNNSVFSPNYDVESYLRRNLNPTRESLNSNRLDKEKNAVDTPYYRSDERNVSIENRLDKEKNAVDTPYYRSDERNVIIENRLDKEKNAVDTPYYRSDERNVIIENRLDKEKNTIDTPYYRSDERNVIIEKAIVHERPKTIERKTERKDIDRPIVVDQFSTNENREGDVDYSRIDVNVSKVTDRPKVDASRPKVADRPKVAEHTRPTRLEGLNAEEDPLPIPVLRHSPKPRTSSAQETSVLSEAMRVVEDKWRVPVVQRNVVRSRVGAEAEGRPASILTQLGSIRRQLQLEQLKLDNMLAKDGGV